MSGAAGQRPWWQDAVIYEIYVRSFQDSNGDGVGDLPGILARLPYLRALGVDAVWLTPFYPSPMADFGYDVAEYCDVDPLFGTLADFDALIAAFRANGIRTLVDLVPNHTSDRHPWFVESRSSRFAPRRDWYLWRDPSSAGGPPNNWLSQAGGPAWTFDPASGQYYMHSFLPQQPDLNWRHPGVRQAIMEVLRFWLDRGVDGFRVDVLTGLLKDALMRDDPPNPAYRAGDPAFMTLEPVRSSNQPEVMQIVAEMRALLDRYPGERVLVGEVYRPVETLVAFHGTGTDGVQLPFNFNLMWLRWVAWGVERLARTYEGLLPPGAWPTWVIGNHDQPRVATRLGPAQARIAMMLLLTLRGTPTLYQGDELGMEDVAIPPGRSRDPFCAAGPGRGRDPQRAPMPWSALPGAGFTAGDPWLPLPMAGRPPPVDLQNGDAASMLSLTRALLRLRRQEPCLARGAWRAVSSQDGVLVYDRMLDDRRCRVLLNFTHAGVASPYGLPGARVALGSHPGRTGERSGSDVELAPDEGLLLVPDGGDG